MTCNATLRRTQCDIAHNDLCDFFRTVPVDTVTSMGVRMEMASLDLPVHEDPIRHGGHPVIFPPKNIGRNPYVFEEGAQILFAHINHCLAHD